MILAAGFGTRLLPHTRYRPKPLFPILNEPLLLLTVRRLKRYGFGRIIINCHHLREQIIAALAGMEGVILQPEETILGTGGGLRKAYAKLADEPLLVTNGDIYHTIDYLELLQAHREKGCSVTMAMHDCPRFNKVVVSGDRVVGFDEDAEGLSRLAFTGLHVLEPQILELLADGQKSCIIDLYRSLLTRGREIATYRADQCFWTDMGTPEDYLNLHAGLLGGNIPRWQEFNYMGQTPLLVADEAGFSGKSCFQGWCSIGAASGSDAQLSRVVVWDGVELPAGYAAEDELISVNPVLQGD